MYGGLALKTSLRGIWPTLAILLIILGVCLALWAAMDDPAYVDVSSDNGVWDLTEFDFNAQSARLVGDVQYIPGEILSPVEFEARGDSIEVGRVDKTLPAATSRLTILLPDGDYQLTRQSIDYAYRLYANGKQALEVGYPAEMKEAATPDTGMVLIAASTEGGAIELVQHSANHWHREGTSHDNIRIGLPGRVRAPYPLEMILIVMGCFLSLSVVHLAQFFLGRRQKIDLYFSLFCLTWFLRTGVTGGKAFTVLWPALSWFVKMRIEYLSLPITAALFILMLNALFPQVLPRWFRRAVYGVSAAFSLAFLVVDTLNMSRAMVPCYVFLGLSIALVILFFAMRFRHPRLDQMVCLAGVTLFLYASIRDMFYYSGKIFFPSLELDLSRISMLVFVFYQMCAIFIYTRRHAHEMSTRLAQAEARYEEALKRERSAARLSDYPLAPREREVLLLLIDGKTRQQVADVLGLSMGTVNTYCSRIYQKTGSDGLSDLLRKFYLQSN